MSFSARSNVSALVLFLCFLSRSLLSLARSLFAALLLLSSSSHLPVASLVVACVVAIEQHSVREDSPDPASESRLHRSAAPEPLSLLKRCQRVSAAEWTHWAVISGSFIARAFAPCLPPQPLSASINPTLSPTLSSFLPFPAASFRHVNDQAGHPDAEQQEI